jgi:hypothetical protein
LPSYCTGVEEQPSGLLEDRQHRLAAGARPAAEDGHGTLVEQAAGPASTKSSVRDRVSAAAASDLGGRGCPPAALISLEGVQFDVAKRRRR